MVHPRKIYGFYWSDAIHSHLSRHQIAWWEVEEVFWNEPTWAENDDDQPGDYLMYGKTDSGRRLTIVVVQDDVRDLLRVVTGWDSDSGERTKYFDE